MDLRPEERLVLPLDVPDLGAAEGWIRRMRGEVGVFKVGLELFTAAGPDAVRRVHDAGAQCFLDLKLHDISATMARATSAAVALGARYLTVHASAGPAALAAVAEAARGSRTQILAVTVLTSMDDDALRSIGVHDGSDAAVDRLAALAQDVGGFVCSPLECARLRAAHPDALLAVPGVRPAGTGSGDQRRVATPEEAIRSGADLLVVGRPIRDAPDPVAAARAITAALR